MNESKLYFKKLCQLTSARPVPNGTPIGRVVGGVPVGRLDHHSRQSSNFVGPSQNIITSEMDKIKF